MPRHDTVRDLGEDTQPMLQIGDDTEPIVIDTTRSRRFAVVMPVFRDPKPAPPRPRWADGVVPRRGRR